MARDNSTVKVSFLGDASQLAREARRASGAMDATASRASALGSKLGKAFAAGAAGAAAGAVVLAKSAINAASDMSEAISKNQQVFGDSAESVRAWAADSQKNLLLTRQAAVEAAATFGNLFVSIGVQGPEAAKMSTALVGLAEDLSSFNNVSVDDALTALRSGLLGEVAPMRRFGVALSESRIQAEAYAIGIAKPVKSAQKIASANIAIAAATQKLTDVQKKHGKGTMAEAQAQDDLTKATGALDTAMAGQKVTLTATEKSAAAYSIIMKDTATAQGDAVRTQDGLANQSRILKKQLGDLNAELGEKLLPYALQATEYLSDLVTEFQNGTGDGGKLRDALSQVADAAKAMGDVLLPIARFFVEHPNVFLSLAGTIGALKLAMELAAARAALMSTGLFSVAGGTTAATTAAGPATAAMAGLGTASAVALGQIGAALAAAYGAYKLYGLIKDVASGNGSAGSAEFEPYDPYSTGGAMNGGGGGATLGLPTRGQPNSTDKRRDEAAARNRRPVQAPTSVERAVAAAQSPAAKVAAEAKKTQYAADQAAANAKRAADAKAAADKKASDRLEAEADRRQKIADRIEAATDKVRAALEARASISDKVRDSLLSFSSIVQGGMSWTASDLAAAFRKKLAVVQRFQKTISALVHKGFDATIIQQIADAGVEGGMATAIGLAGASADQVKQINKTQKAINDAAGATGDRVAKGVMGNITIPIDVYLDGKKLAPDLAKAVNDFNRGVANNGNRNARAA